VQKAEQKMRAACAIDDCAFCQLVCQKIPEWLKNISVKPLSTAGKVWWKAFFGFFKLFLWLKNWFLAI
jgi:hypothetical protein